MKKAELEYKLKQAEKEAAEANARAKMLEEEVRHQKK